MNKVYFNSPWSISTINADDLANDMHEEVVIEIISKLLEGTIT